MVVPHQQLGVFVQHVVGDLAGDLDDGGVVLGLPGAAEAGADGFETEELQAALRRGPVLVELAEEAAGAEFVEVGGLVGGGDVPAVLGLDAEPIVVLRQVAEFLEVGGQVGVDRAGYLGPAVVAEEVLGQVRNPEDLERRIRRKLNTGSGMLNADPGS